MIVDETLVQFEIKMSFKVIFALITVRVCAIAVTKLIASPPVTVGAVLRSWGTMDEPCYDHWVRPQWGDTPDRTGRCIVPPPGGPAGIRGSCAGNAPPRFVSRFTQPDGHYPDKLI